MTTGKYILLIAAIALGGLAIYYTITPGTQQTDQVELAEELETSKSIYLSSLVDLEGNTTNMNPDQLVFLNVWATWCGPCNLEMPGIQSLYEKYKDNKKIAFYIVSDEDASIVTPFIQRKGYQLPFYQYAGRFPAELDGNAIPRTYLLLNGKVVDQEIGASQWDSPEKIAFIEKQLEGI
jgi:thiol-disulfide isomerase/thioredoxin